MEEELDLGRYVRIFRQRWKLILVGTLVGAVAAVAGASLRPVLYEAETTILIGRSNTLLASATSRALLENRTLAAQTLSTIGVAMSPQTFVSTALVVEQVPGTNVMRVKVTLGDPVKAAQASRALSQKAVELNRRIASEEGTAVRGQLKVLLDQSAERLKTAEEQYLSYQDQAQVELLKKDTERMIAERGELLKLRIDVAAEKARLQAAEQEIAKQERVLSLPRAAGIESALRGIDERSAATLANERALHRAEDGAAAFANAIDKPLPPALANRDSGAAPARTDNQKTTDREKEARQEPNRDFSKELDKRFEAQASAVGATKDALEQLAATSSEQAAADLLDLSHPFINPVYETLAFQIATGRTRLAALERQQREITAGKLAEPRFGELSDLYRRTAELARLENQLDLAKRVHGDLTVKYEQSRSESVGSMVQLQIVDEAVTPERPLSRKRAQAAALGMTAGFVLAGLAALAWSARPGNVIA